MKKLKAKWLILDHYIKAIETQFTDFGEKSITVRVWKPIVSFMLPAYQMRYIMHSCAETLQTESVYSEGRPRSRWYTKNPDFGCYDAQLTVREDVARRVVDIYFCSILCRPYSREAHSHYGAHCGLEPMERLLLMWDSRMFDAMNGYSRIYGFEKPADSVHIYNVTNPERDICENIPYTVTTKESVADRLYHFAEEMICQPGQIAVFDEIYETRRGIRIGDRKYRFNGIGLDKDGKVIIDAYTSGAVHRFLTLEDISDRDADRIMNEVAFIAEMAGNSVILSCNTVYCVEGYDFVDFIWFIRPTGEFGKDYLMNAFHTGYIHYLIGSKFEMDGDDFTIESIRPGYCLVARSHEGKDLRTVRVTDIPKEAAETLADQLIEKENCEE